MKFLRLLLALWLSVSVPLLATAGIAKLELGQNCPMQMKNGISGVAKLDCCDTEQRKHGHSGDPCKQCQDCKACHAVSTLPACSKQQTVPETVEKLILATESPTLTQSNAGFWRPPRSL